ncbi:N-acetylmuramoyl-L-alanine amidase [Clostridium moniliforme]|uniref:N-acetylmuramoyl-L-alanine amidase n=1 Tax=Clostridium moniliforme TaxID=39489 RepID=A0ABS4EY55_9CLOT|nr:N-acetylmuramoyl-L-alanine amidase [Clostridium moniliforme]MBP1888928.1 N-acetylmuramoyl-L-alanine amidase [Clostridium moniliforme]
MKIGIDINCSDISRAVRTELKKKGYYIVDMFLEEKITIGEEVFKKAILINTSKLDFFLLVQINEKEENTKIYYKDKISKDFSLKLQRKLRDIGINNINYNNGNKFYLMKNTEVPTVIIKMNLEKIQEKKEELIQILISCLESLKD